MIDDLTGTEQAVLLVLMAESRPVPNPGLSRLGPELRKASRDRLNRLKLIETTKVGRGLVHELTDKGWRECAKLFGAATPARSSGQGKALYTLLGALSRYMTRGDLRPSDLFWPDDLDGANAEADMAQTDREVEDRVRQAYSRLTRRPGGWVGLVRLRAELVDVPRSVLDAALVRMYRQAGVSLIPEENQKALSAEDREAAVDIGEQDKHLIAIEP